MDEWRKENELHRRYNCLRLEKNRSYSQVVRITFIVLHPKKETKRG